MYRNRGGQNKAVIVENNNVSAKDVETIQGVINQKSTGNKDLKSLQ